MRGINCWQHKPYKPYDKIEKAYLPFICRVEPHNDSFRVDWFDNGSNEGHEFQWRQKGSSEAWKTISDIDSTVRISGLDENQEYEFRVIRKNKSNESSETRYVRTGKVPGKVVNYLHKEDEIYSFSGRALCSPSIVKLPSGSLLASMDLYAPGAPQNLTLIYRSDDRGESWYYVADLFPCYWGTLFMHKGRLYMQGCSTEYGDILIGASDDEGYTWTPPVRLFSGSSSALSSGWQRTPMPIVQDAGRLFVSVDYGAWKEGGHKIGTLSILENEDLLESKNWVCSDLVSYDPKWSGAPEGKSRGPLEGNMVIGKDNKLYNVLRIDIGDCTPSHGIALMLEVDKKNPEKKPQFRRFINMPSGSNSKSYILFDEISNTYYAIGNICVNEKTPTQRNVLALQVSENLYDWRVVEILQDYRNEDPRKVGFQYITFIFDGEDILYLSRTGMNDAKNYHDANYITFNIIKNFRKLIKE